ncbi:heterokaryon incompatibility protein-domain-containing protein [Xylaria digitata]|nr:heterokaryon incompatibility protein-domain-containing protein [Xylaria digitata]
MESSIYQPLEDRDEIRILELLPHEGSNAPIDVRFHHVKLSQRPRFEALSYTWGDQDTQYPVTVNEAGDTVAVGSNCISALRALRQADEPRRLWIDALCINQADIEKGSQIPIIGNVYNSASRTIIFLQYSGSNEAFRGNGAGPEMQRCWEAGILGQETEQPVLDDAARQELFDVSNYPWFERSWIIQETFLSFDRIVICSPFFWSWETFIRLAPSGTNMDVIRISDDYSINKSNTGGWNHVWDGQIGERMPGDMLPIAALEYLVDTRKFKCKLYDDRVYSILSLFNPSLPVPIGYGYSKEEVHEHLSGALIEIGDSRFLYSTHRQSWRANWDEAVNDSCGDEIRYIGASRAMLHVRRESQWSRIGYVSSSNGSRGTIRALGFHVGVVTRISRTGLGGEEHELKQRWDAVVTELDEPAREKGNGKHGSTMTISYSLLPKSCHE